jgi:DNA-binding MarR family transcriptional regulator
MYRLLGPADPPIRTDGAPGGTYRVDIVAMREEGALEYPTQRRLLQQAMSSSRTLSQEIHQEKPFTGLEEEAFLGLQRTASLLMQALGRELKGHDLSPAQYNTLRILRGALPDALTCGEIGERLVSPGPDVTRLLDRLEQRGLVTRLRDAEDRRVVRARITPEGADLLARLDEPVDHTLRRLLGSLGRAKLQTLVELLEEARAAT